MLQLADGDFNRILERGFESSIRREWEWRLKRGESTRNLEAFQKLRPAEDAAGEDAASSDSPASSPSAATPGPGAPAPPTS